MREADGFELLAACTTLPGLVEAGQALQPDVALIELTPEVAYGELLELRRALPGVRLVLWVREVGMELAFQAVSAGVRGILRMALPVESQLRCLQKVHQGELWIERTLTEAFILTRRFSLSQRQGQIVSLISQGLTNKEIAATLQITEGTVKVYLNRLFDKLGVKSRHELAIYGLHNSVDCRAPGLPSGRKLSALRSLVMPELHKEPL